MEGGNLSRQFSWLRRGPLYWFVLTIGPVVIAATMYLDRRFADLLQSIGGWQWFLGTAAVIWSFVLTWLFMFAIYAMVPNTVVA